MFCRVAREPKSWLILSSRSLGMSGSFSGPFWGSWISLWKLARGTIPIMKKALFQAEEAALKRGAISGSLALKTMRLNSSSCASAVPGLVASQWIFCTLCESVDLLDEKMLSLGPCDVKTVRGIERIDSVDFWLQRFVGEFHHRMQ